MLARNLNFLVEKLVLAILCIWGTWGLYYLVAVLGLDSSLADLGRLAPLVAVQCVATFALFWRFPMVAPAAGATGAPPRAAGKALSRKQLLLPLLAGVVAAVGVVLAQRFGLTQSALAYNLLWALLLPLFILLALGYSLLPGSQPNEIRGERTSGDTALLDVMLLLALAVFLAGKLYGSGFHTYDDAYYGFIFSSLLADPGAPVLATDNLFGSGAPYVLHPAYRTVGYEVLIALVGYMAEVDPLAIYYNVMPAINAVTWLLVTYVFLRVIHVPLPGLALAATVLLTLFWTDAFSLGSSLYFMFWGKSLLFFAAAPLLFIAVARFAATGGVLPWVFLFLSVAATQTWSSTGLFLVPFAAGLATLVFAPLDRRFWRVALFAFLALLPVFCAVAYCLLILSRVEIADNSYNAGIMRIQGQAFGGFWPQMAMLLVLCAVPIAATFVGDKVFRRLALRLSVVAFFTVMTPFLLEWIALVVGSNFLARRLYYAFPLLIFVGILASVGVELLRSGSLFRGGTAPRAAFAAILFTLACFGAVIDRNYLFGDWWQQTEVFRLDYEEAREARKLIPDGAFVAAGDIDDMLTTFPNPPRFVAVRHYLGYYMGALGHDEFWKRMRLHNMLSNKAPLEGDTLQSSARRLLVMADGLGVTTLVFQEAWGNRRPEANLEMERKVPDKERRKFLHWVKKRMQSFGYKCQTTPSKRTWVCNR